MQPQGTTVTPPPVALFVATTEGATRALGGRSELSVTTFPFRVGRERRVGAPAHPTSAELRLGVESQLNDIYLPDPARKHLHISARHFAVEYVAGSFFLRDRGSSCGTIVSGQRIGGDRKGGRTELRSGDEIVIGTHSSPYVFRFEIGTACFARGNDAINGSVFRVAQIDGPPDQPDLNLSADPLPRRTQRDEVTRAF
jgi:hypothetical protein